MKPGAARIAAGLLLICVPLTSGWLAGLPVGFAEMPPETVYVHPPAFSAPLYALLAIALLPVAVFFLRPRTLGFDSGALSDFTPYEWAPRHSTDKRFPWWGWLGLMFVAVSWPAAWLHPDWLGPIADHTFFPLWLGYILVVDAFTHRRSGSSPISRGTAGWLAWFPASAVMWWYFELLNRFVQNWIYLGVDQFSATRYFFGSTLAFATVIPALLTTASLLGTFDRFQRGFVRRDAATRQRPDNPRRVSAALGTLVILGTSGLALLPWFPIVLFPLVWIAPLLVVAGLLELGGLDTGLGRLWRGDWGPVATLAAAALVCGFFWEMWNVNAMPKWIYQVPWLDRYKLFEMPMVGYLGYLPFGPTCWAFWLLLSGRSRS